MTEGANHMKSDEELLLEHISWHSESLEQIKKNTGAAKEWLEHIGWTVVITLPTATFLLFLNLWRHW